MLKSGLKKIQIKIGARAHRSGLAQLCRIALLVLLMPPTGARASQGVTTLKQVQISNGSQIDLLFDGKVQKSQIRTEFVNDIIQLSITDVSVYPAKISSVNGGSLTKIFAYQYAPKLVRCRLTVKGKAEDFKDKLEIKASGRILTVRMQGDDAIAKASAATPHPTVTLGSEPDAEERALLTRVIAGSTAAAQAAQSAASAKAVAVTKAVVAAKVVPAVNEKPVKDSITTGAAAPTSAVSNTENLPVHLSGESSAKIAGGKPLPSPLKAFGKMGIVIGLFGLFAFALKRFAQGKTEARIAHPGALAEVASKGGWLGTLGQMAKKGLNRNTRMIEVLSTHYLGPKKSIAVVRIAGRVLVLGVSNESINLITQLSGEDASDPLSSVEGLDLGMFGVGNSTSPASAFAGALGKSPAAVAPRVQAAAAAAGATAAGKPIFSEMLQAERSKPAFANPAGVSGYGAPATNPNVRAQIRNRLEGLKQL